MKATSDGCEDSIEIEVLGGEADLQISKEASTNPALVGETLTYTLEVMNHGPNDATGVVITDTLPNELSFKRICLQPTLQRILEPNGPVHPSLDFHGSTNDSFPLEPPRQNP